MTTAQSQSFAVSPETFQPNGELVRKYLWASHFDECLVVEALLVADDLQRDEAARLVVEALHYLPEAAVPDEREDLVAVRDVVVEDDAVVAPVVVEAEIILRVAPGLAAQHRPTRHPTPPEER